jgi:hypothetical protein
MNTRPFFQVVPTPVKLWAWITVIGAVVTGIAVGLCTAAHRGSFWTIPLYGVAGLFLGALLATWLLGLGFVFADARRRAMRPVLWVFVAILFPHLLGFLLYFVMRQPLASPCGHCGQTVPSGQRFCSWCGTLQTNPPSADAPPPFGQSSGTSH